MNLTDEDRGKLDGKTIVASVSGGKDSAAMSLWLTEHGLEHRRVWANTQWEAQVTEDYIRGPLTAKLGPIDEVAGPRGFEELAIHKGMFPSRLKRFCTTELKVKPIQRYMAAIDDDLVNAVGIRADESAARAKMTRWEWNESFDCWVWRPMLEWTMDDVVAIHKRHGLLPNPLYLQGASRVGCWPCINARKSEITLVAETDPARVDRIRALEQRVGDEAYARAERRADEGKEPFVFRNRPTMFHSHGRQMPNAGNDDKSTWVPDVPIDDIVKWARTSRGGRQYQLDLGDKDDDGCMRWGLCESAEEG
jgi:3'-phosphoadenosine 5'-phosphosulfate sulfotransferase (PAPS reductase)/FAD synthetase